MSEDTITTHSFQEALARTQMLTFASAINVIESTMEDYVDKPCVQVKVFAKMCTTILQGMIDQLEARCEQQSD